MEPIIEIKNVTKTYKGGFQALKNVDLTINKGEIFALLGPNGAGKTTLISIICGIVNSSGGSIKVGGYDILKDYKKTRSMIGLVPQELSVQTFESVWDTVRFTRGLFGKEPNDAYLDQLLKNLTLSDKKKNKILTLSGGMKRRVLIAKALSHEPRILFLDEPTAGVDVELRQDMWDQINELRKSGVTIILTTHYIEEAEEMADRIGVINKGEIILVEETKSLIKKLGQKQLTVDLQHPLPNIPERLSKYSVDLGSDNSQLIYNYQSTNGQADICDFIQDLSNEKIRVKDLHTSQSSLEEIFVRLVNQ